MSCARGGGPFGAACHCNCAVELAVEERDPVFLTRALREVAKARGMTDVASAAGITREGLYKALSDDGDPRLTTLLGVLGLRLSISEADEQAGIAIGDEASRSGA